MKTYTAKDILAGSVAAILLTVALMGVYGWMLGLVFGIFLVVAFLLVDARIIR